MRKRAVDPGEPLPSVKLRLLAGLRPRKESWNFES